MVQRFQAWNENMEWIACVVCVAAAAEACQDDVIVEIVVVEGVLVLVLVVLVAVVVLASETCSNVTILLNNL